MINFNDKVMIIDNKQVYTLYDSFLIDNAPAYKNNFAYAMMPNNGIVGEVKGCGYHEYGNGEYLYVIKIKDRVFIVEEKGIKLVNNNDCLIENDDENFCFFDWKGFKNGELAILCNTKEKVNVLLKKCQEHKIKWVGGNKVKQDNLYDIYGKTTLIRYDEGLVLTSTLILNEYDEDRFIIVPYENIFN